MFHYGLLHYGIAYGTIALYFFIFIASLSCCTEYANDTRFPLGYTKFFLTVMSVSFIISKRQIVQTLESVLVSVAVWPQVWWKLVEFHLYSLLSLSLMTSFTSDVVEVPQHFHTPSKNKGLLSVFPLCYRGLSQRSATKGKVPETFNR